MNCSSGWPARCASAGSLSRSGPIFAVAPAGWNVWQLLQPCALKTASPAPPPEPPSFFCWPFAQERNLSRDITSAVERISAWPSPQSSVQMTGNEPIRSGVIASVFTEPGTASCFWPNSGTQKEWVTSREVICSLTGAPIGSSSLAEARLPKAGYLNDHSNCWAVTFTTSGLSGSDAAEACGRWSFLARTVGLTVQIAVPRTPGTAVQTTCALGFPG